MEQMTRILAKVGNIFRKGLATARNILFARLGIWPVRKVSQCDIAAVPAFCINLQRAHAKRALMSRQASELGLRTFAFVDAIDARTIDRSRLISENLLSDTDTLKYHPKPLTLNEVACSLSHRVAYRLILEDDALFLWRRIRMVSLARIPKDFDVVFLNTFLLDEPPLEPLADNIYSDASYGGSAAAYLVSAQGARKLLAASAPVVHAADGLLGRCLSGTSARPTDFRQQGATTVLKGYIVYPDCVLNGSTCHYHVSEVQVGQ
jgi:glycosyl transferase family 25